MAGQNQQSRGDGLQTEGRKENAAQPLDAAKDRGGPERYPAVRQDDAIEESEALANRPPTTYEGRLGPAGDPAEGKR